MGRLQKAKTLTVGVKADPAIDLAFSLDEADWVLSALRMCGRILTDG